MVDKETNEIINVSEVASYVVCPEAWSLKRRSKSEGPVERTAHETEVRRKKKEWIDSQALSSQFRAYATILYCLLVLIVIVLFLFDTKRELFGVGISQIIQQATVSSSADIEPTPKTTRIRLSKMLTVPNEIFLVLVLIGALILLWDLFDRRSTSLHKKAGFKESVETIALQGSDDVPSKRLYSDQLHLESEPTAIVKKGRNLVPVVVKPGGRKVQDRHVIEVLVHLRLLEEVYGSKPPYGMIMLGSDKRQVRIKNTDEKQRWLDTVLDEMRSISDGVPAVPAPSYYKCRSCEVRQHCSHSAYAEKEDPSE